MCAARGVHHDVDRAGVEHEAERRSVFHLGAGRLSRRGNAVVRHFREAVPLPLRRRLEADAVRQIVVRELETVIERLANRAAFRVARLGTARLEEMEFAAVVRGADRRGAVVTANPERAVAVERPEARVLLRAGGGLIVL